MSEVNKSKKKRAQKKTTKKATKKMASEVKKEVKPEVTETNTQPKLAERKRQVDVNSLTVEQADKLSQQIGKEIAKIMDEANNSCNKLLGIYGLRTTISYEIVKIEAEEAKT